MIHSKNLQIDHMALNVISYWDFDSSPSHNMLGRKPLGSQLQISYLQSWLSVFCLLLSGN
jgi:hypothetical protein